MLKINIYDIFPVLLCKITKKNIVFPNKKHDNIVKKAYCYVKFYVSVGERKAYYLRYVSDVVEFKTVEI